MGFCKICGQEVVYGDLCEVCIDTVSSVSDKSRSRRKGTYLCSACNNYGSTKNWDDSTKSYYGVLDKSIEDVNGSNDYHFVCPNCNEVLKENEIEGVLSNRRS